MSGRERLELDRVYEPEDDSDARMKEAVSILLAETRDEEAA